MEAGYSTQPNEAVGEQRGSTPWMLVFGNVKPESEGILAQAADWFTCLVSKQEPL